jgi:hypothetical protein
VIELEERDVHLNNEYISLLEKPSTGNHQEKVNVKELDEKVRNLEL